MTAADLRKQADIAPNTLTRMKKDQTVTMQVFERICDVLDTDFGDVVEYIQDDSDERT
ncbi:helix-turn-helix domain-containing protein [Pseudoruminococcus massiliensis]|uniref:helix-turn-helix domain-containing protein n=1 Tax=Pseudoruminococcus massiliensis TaxID=2086583 RepID=UPI0022E04740|nr:helix-turn-helix transcriptional regulator [Pseudoruminococcus massiliensis]